MRRPARGWTVLILRTGLVLAIAGASPWPPPSAIRAQEVEDLTAGIRRIREALDRARLRMEELDFAGAIRDLEVIIAPRASARPAELELEEIDVLATAYDLRARARFNLGRIDAARSDFETLVRLAPGYSIDRQSLSPKVVALFDEVRSRVAGILLLKVEPPDAQVLVDGAAVEGGESGVTLLAGSRALRVVADGHDPYEERLTVVAGAEIRREIRLRPNRRSLRFITVPAGVAVSLDSEPVGKTRGPAISGTAALATRYGFDPADASAPFEVPLVTPGRHGVSFEKECFRTKTVTIDVSLDLEENAPMRFAPVILEPARTDLKISSRPSRADVFLDGKRIGATPLSVGSVCGGEREVEIVKPGVGSWRERIRLTADRANVLDVRLRPTLLYAGTFRLDDWGRVVWSDEDGALLDELARGLETLNLVRSPEVLEEIRASIIEWMISDPAEARAGTLLTPAILKEAESRAGADLVLAGLTLANDPNRTWNLALYSVLHSSPDRFALRTDRPQGARDLVRRLDAAPAERETWWGLGMVDTLLRGRAAGHGPLVVRVLPGSPAAKAGLRVGDRVLRVGRVKVRGVEEAARAMTGQMAGPGGLRTPVVLDVDDGTGARTVRMEPGSSPAVIPLFDPTLLYNRALAEFRLRSRSAEDEAERGVALLNLGIAYMHFRAYERARSAGFARASLPPGPGISEGTVLYYRGLAALRMGDPRAARSAFQKAASAAGATIDSGDGPSAAAAARRMLAALAGGV
ncbi:MAG: PEGA domain-containing protein [Gemmatimonadota bacterium]